jgi:chemotaxis protein MotB
MFVDMLSTVLMVIIFVLMTFVVSQFYLADTINDRESRLKELRQTLEKMQRSILNITHQRDDKEKKLQQLGKNIDSLQTDLRDLSSKLGNEQKKTTTLNGHNTSLSQQVSGLTIELKKLEKLLEKVEKDLKDKECTLEETKKDLNISLSQKITELDRLKKDYDKLECAHQEITKNKEGDISAFRSEFFEQLQKIIGTRQDIRVVGDRFVFQSEVLFPQGSAQLEQDGKKQLDFIATTLKELEKKIPSSVHWILRIDGHTDKVPIKTKEFASNWELSCGRAIAVVEYMISKGIAPNRLVAAGFGQFQPITQVAKDLSKNRRIEFKLDRR